MLGTLLDGRYSIISQLGRGYYGETYLAEDLRRMKRQCVVKRLKPASNDPNTLREAKLLFDSEARVLESLGRRHEKTPDLLDYFIENEEFYLVQELVEGYPLSTLLADGQQLPEAEVFNLLVDVLEILNFVHQSQVIHRDIKPSNIIRRHKDGRSILIDFGAVKQVNTQIVVGNGQVTFTRAIGTPGYMPIEQARGRPRYASDIYALGMSAIQALTGVAPSELSEDADGEIIWRDRAQVSPHLAAILDKMVRFQISDRYQSADKVLYDLQQLQRFSSTPTRRRSLPPIRLHPRNLSALVAGGATLLLFLLGTQIYAYSRFGVFPADVFAVMRSLPSSLLLERSAGGRSVDAHRAPLSVNAPIFSNYNCVTFSSDGQTFATGSGDGSIKIWDFNTGKLQRLLTGHSGHVHSLTLSPDGEILASGSGDRTIKLWNPHTGKLIQTLSGGLNHVNSVAIATDGQTLASGSNDGIVKLWNLNTGQLRHNLNGHSGDVNAVAISRDGQILATGSSDETIKLWNLDTGKLIRTISGAGNVFSLATSNNGQIASGSSDGTIKLWNLNTGQLVRTLSSDRSVVTSVAIGSDGKTLASNSSDRVVKLWNLETGKLRHTLIGYVTGNADYFNAVAFSPRGQTLVSGTGNGTIDVWRVPQQ
ncbi:serine/threonine-protein kinase [Chroococcidiopsis thermalis]|uniref:Serine/threonine protein kinase with WD40 repeats n=1 Tax=Chroococcidiopsis thermalis (strain PCC 7203) TaxID=251229 RepID=K9U0V5_CHRTP|nr:serine/threonine-protein kinase [Chroococcidiopsis thermalis]AFY88076.1 serine/threonine protein kinase with WD40 repeats [Chroococcidiopsis thermalis PCC 7203]